MPALPSHASRLLPALTALALAAVLFAVPAYGQSGDSDPSFHLGLRAGIADLSGSGIYSDLDGTLNPIGLQGEIRWPAFSLRLAYEQADTDGDLFLSDAPGDLTIDSRGELDLDLLHLTAAYNGEPAGAGWSWYIGGGPSYAEASLTARGRVSQGPVTVSFSDEFDGDSIGVHAVGGVRYALGERFELGGELMYLQLFELLDLGIVSSNDSDDLDGLSGAVSLSFGF